MTAAVLAAGLTGGCALGGGDKPASEAQAPPDTPAALRQDVDRVRAELADLRTRVETLQRGNTEHVDRVAQETRAEFDAVRKSMEASSRHEVQRQVEVLDAQARRIDLLEKRTAELGQILRRVELSLGGLESQLARILDGGSTPAPGARSGSPARWSAAPPGPRPAPESPLTTPAPEASMSNAAAGAGLTPPAMLGPSRSPQGAPATPAAPREAKAPVPVRAPQDEPLRVAKAPPEASGIARPSAKTGTTSTPPAPGSATARVLFERAMENWNKGEQGQAVLEFEELVQRFPTDPLAASAQLRIGEAYYTARDFERAAVEYRKAVDLAPKGKDTPQALLRLGLAYRAQKRESDARQAWGQLVRDFPESDASEEARRALRGR
jgi:TolA-binding protein